MRGASARMSASVSGSGTSPSRARRAMPRRIRSGSSRNADGCTARSIPAARSSRPAERVDPGAAADVAGHRVDGEVAPLEIVAHGQARVGLDAEVGVRVAGVVRARPGRIGVSRRGGTTSMPSFGPNDGRNRTPTSRPATRSSSAGP